MSHPNLKTYGPVEIPGTSVVAFLSHWTKRNEWVYTLWENGELLAKGDINLSVKQIGINLTKVTPEQIARIAFILELEYNNV